MVKKRLKKRRESHWVGKGKHGEPREKAGNTLTLTPRSVATKLKRKAIAKGISVKGKKKKHVSANEMKARKVQGRVGLYVLRS